MRWPVWCGYRELGLWWFRVLGYGVRWKDTRRHRLLFSERVLDRGWYWPSRRWHFLWLRRRDGTMFHSEVSGPYEHEKGIRR